jgi:predicted RNA-binding protein with PUA-like domain
MRVHRKTMRRGDAIFIDHAQAAKVHVRGIVILIE